METLIAEKELTSELSQQRVWDLLGRLIFDSLSGMEKMEIIDENNFRAELKAKAFCIPLTLHIKGEMIDICPPDLLNIRLIAKSKMNLIKVVQRVTFSLNSIGREKVRITCQAIAEDPVPFTRWVLLGQVRTLANQIFDSVEKRLKQLA